MSSHPFKFDGGSELADIGATWFVSYKYHNFCDKLHLNYIKIDSLERRINIFNKTSHYHKYWLEKILGMNNNRLNTNEIGVNARDTKNMANCILSILNSENKRKKPFAILIKRNHNNNKGG